MKWPQSGSLSNVNNILRFKKNLLFDKNELNNNQINENNPNNNYNTLLI